jgi:DNA (cytosine-5)-methyltransferase 1
VRVNAVDLFAGAGGWSHGWRMATGCEPIVAVNHCDHAIHLHRLNHPGTEHWPADVWSVDPLQAVRGRRVDWLHGSPDCTHFSRAKGGKPREQKIRALADVLIPWAAVCRPRVLSLENVVEWLDWGPLHETHSNGCTGNHRRPTHDRWGHELQYADGEHLGCQGGCWFGHPIKERKGELFREWLAKLQALGYAVDWRVLCAADYGAPTIRKRLFLLARNDGQPIRWPEPTHANPAKRDLFSAGLQPWRTAAECIDWSIPCPSIFGRKRPLAPATCRRIAAGIVRFVLQGEPFIVTCNHGKDGFRGQGLGEPFKTITASRDAHGLVVPTLATMTTRSRSRSVEEPATVVTAGGNHHALVATFLQQNFTGMVGKPLCAPVPTITARDHHSLVAASLTTLRGTEGSHLHGDAIEAPLRTVSAGGQHHALVAAFLTQFYSSGGQHSRAYAPLPAVVTKARHGLVTVTIDGAEYAIADIGLRMLSPRELARAQGFPDSYVLEGTLAQQIARVGNSVCPDVAAAIVRANLGRGAAVA